MYGRSSGECAASKPAHHCASLSRNRPKRFDARQTQHALIACESAGTFELPCGDNAFTRARSSRSRQVWLGSHRRLPSKPSLRAPTAIARLSNLNVVIGDAAMAGPEQDRLADKRAWIGRAAIIIGALILSRLFLVALYAASTSPGTALGDFATMIVFP